jgi:hypothetical protein
MSQPRTLLISGGTLRTDVPDDMPLLWVLCDVLGLTGTKFGAGSRNVVPAQCMSTASRFAPVCWRWALSVIARSCSP